jgi:hypothetical protein
MMAPLLLMSLQAYARRVARGFRPPIDEAIPRKVRDIMTAAWSHNPANRPSMTQIIKQLKDVQVSEAGCE